MDEIKNPYQMSLIKANETKLYNQGAFWAFNTAKYRALLSNDPTVIKYWYRHEAGKFFPDVAFRLRPILSVSDRKTLHRVKSS